MRRSRGLVRIVLDTNALVSALLTHGGPAAQLTDLWLDEGFVLVSSAEQLDELRRVLAYPHLRSRISPVQRSTLLENIANVAQLVRPRMDIAVSTDPDDNVILGTAVAGNADMIVSGDVRHMLGLGSVEGIPIVGPRDALGRFGTE
jgi:uncharacterized protein